MACLTKQEWISVFSVCSTVGLQEQAKAGDFIQEPSVQHLKGLLGEVDPKTGPGVPGLRLWLVSKFPINVLCVWVCVAG